jgi:hypothetical protein
MIDYDGRPGHPPDRTVCGGWLSISLPAHPRPTCGSRPARTRCRVCGAKGACWLSISLPDALPRLTPAPAFAAGAVERRVDGSTRT